MLINNEYKFNNYVYMLTFYYQLFIYVNILFYYTHNFDCKFSYLIFLLIQESYTSTMWQGKFFYKLVDYNSLLL